MAMFNGLTIKGNYLNNSLYGSLAADTIFGRGGDDLIYGKGGNDSLWGEQGSDQFVFESTRASNGFDNIKDYKWSSAVNGDKDVLNLTKILDVYAPSQKTLQSYVWLLAGPQGATLYIDLDGLGNTYSAQSWALLEGVAVGDQVGVSVGKVWSANYTLTLR